MITLSAEIAINNIIPIGITISPENRNNISRADLPTEFPHNDNDNPFILGVSRLGDGSKLQSETNLYISAQKSDENGNFGEPFKLFITPYLQSQQLLTIRFDTINNRHPNFVYINGTPYQDDDATFTILVDITSPYEIEIRDWNTPNCPLIISAIVSWGTLEINRRNCISIETNIAERDKYDLPSYGIISNKGSVSFRDVDGEIRDLIKDGYLKKGLSVKMFLNNTLYKNIEKSQIAEYFIENIDYSAENQSVNISLTDGLTEWQNTNIKAISFDPRSSEPKTLRWYYETLVAQNPNQNKYGFMLFDALSEETKSILENTIIQYPLLESGSYWAQWTKVCQAGALYLYKGRSAIILNHTDGS